jgi:uncharacterized membrane protein (DUF2068 family)
MIMSSIDSNLNEKNFETNTRSASNRRPPRLSLFSIIIAISGSLLVLAAIPFTGGSHALVFLIPDFGILALPNAVTIMLVIANGVGFIVTGVGLWYLKKWAFELGIVLSLIDVATNYFANDISSFTFIRGAIVLIYLVRTRRDLGLKY